MTPTVRVQPARLAVPWLLATLLLPMFWDLAHCTVWERDGDIPGVHGIGILDAMGNSPELGSADVDKKRSWDYGPILSNLASSMFQRRHAGATNLENNVPSRNHLLPGDTHQFVFPLSQMQAEFYAEEQTVPFSGSSVNSALAEDGQTELKRSDGHTVYLSVSVCGQPATVGEDSALPPKGLDLYISSSGRSDPGPTSSDTEADHLETDEGLAMYAHEFNGDVYLAVHAPALDGHSGDYTYEVAASIDNFHSNYKDQESLFVLDNDHQSGLFSTTGLTNAGNTSAIDDWTASGAPFTIFVHDQEDPRINGLRKSYCGLQSTAQVHISSAGVEKGITTAGTNTARQQFYVPGLNSRTPYHAFLALPSNYSGQGSGVPTGGGTVWKSAEFATDPDASCKVLFNLTFCDSVSYAAPAPASGSISTAELSKKYDSYAESLFQNFSLSLQQIPCNTTPEAQYSLATNCTACSSAYKDWLCAVTIPRCASTAKNTSASIPRNASTSRSLFIQQDIQPGTYNELPPCGDLCFGLVQNCPASLGFACPDTGSLYFNQSYGYSGGNSSNPTCNSPGKSFSASSGSLSSPPQMLAILLATGFAITLC